MQFGVSMAVSLALLKTLQSLNVPKLSIKWPNDILSANKKIGGILIENVLTGNTVKYAIIGVGINVNETDFHELPQASSMKLETGETFQLEELQDVLLRNMLEKLKKLSTFDFSEMKFNYEENLFQKGKVSVFETSENSLFNGIIKGVSNIGELLVDTENEGLRKFQLKEVKLIY